MTTNLTHEQLGLFNYFNAIGNLKNIMALEQELPIKSIEANYLEAKTTLENNTMDKTTKLDYDSFLIALKLMEKYKSNKLTNFQVISITNFSWLKLYETEFKSYFLNNENDSTLELNNL